MAVADIKPEMLGVVATVGIVNELHLLYGNGMHPVIDRNVGLRVVNSVGNGVVGVEKRPRLIHFGDHGTPVKQLVGYGGLVCGRHRKGQNQHKDDHRDCGCHMF